MGNMFTPGDVYGRFHILWWTNSATDQPKVLSSHQVPLTLLGSPCGVENQPESLCPHGVRWRGQWFRGISKVVAKAFKVSMATLPPPSQSLDAYSIAVVLDVYNLENHASTAA